MSRADRLRNLDKDPYHGLFNAVITKIDNYKVNLRDILTNYSFEIDFSLKDDIATTKSGKQVWLNQHGQVGYGNEEDLLKSFTTLYNSTERKQYWPAMIGEVHLFDFLKNLHNINIFDLNANLKKNDYYVNDPFYFRELFLSDKTATLTIGGIMYVDEMMCQKVLPRYIPSHKVSILKNVNGDFSKVTDPSLRDLTNLFTGVYKPKGFFRWENLSNFVLPIIPKLHDTDI